VSFERNRSENLEGTAFLGYSASDRPKRSGRKDVLQNQFFSGILGREEAMQVIVQAERHAGRLANRVGKTGSKRSRIRGSCVRKIEITQRILTGALVVEGFFAL
jgi:hypothetical protein